eukprot:2301800-Pleurochrysis_carterae.AAC.1
MQACSRCVQSVCSECEHKLHTPPYYWHGVIESGWWLWSLSAGSRQFSADEVQSVVSCKLANMSECLADAWPRFLDRSSCIRRFMKPVE